MVKAKGGLEHSILDWCGQTSFQSHNSKDNGLYFLKSNCSKWEGKKKLS